MKTVSTLSRNVFAMLGIGAALAVIGLASILVVNSQIPIAARIHEYQRDDGAVNRVVDPWRPLPGCIFLQSSQGNVLWPLDGKNNYKPAMTEVCGSPSAVLPDGVVSPALNQLLLSANNQWRAPLQRTDRLPINGVEQGGMTIPQGAHIDLSLNAVLQSRVQQLAECMTGSGTSCAAVGLAENIWAENSEGAAARMFGVVMLDVKNGAVLALGSAHSACYEAEYSGKFVPDHCPTPSLMRDWPLPGKLDHHVFSDAKPGSLVKIIMVIAFMRDPLLGPRLRMRDSTARNALLEDIKHSDSPNFLDRAYCRELGFVRCTRMQRIADAANDLSWNAQPKDLLALAGIDASKPSINLATPHFMQGLTIEDQKWQWTGLSLKYATEEAARCAIQNRWKKCNGEVANTASELMGQGNAVASPLTIAGMLRKIALAANGERKELPTHLLQSVRGQLHGKGAILHADATPVPLRIGQDEANLILEGMARTHQGGENSAVGTARSACLAAYGGGLEAARSCDGLKGVSGKTGTPSFAHESLSWSARTAYCMDIQRQLMQTDLSASQKRRLLEQRAHCVHSPVKWYAAALRADPASDNGPYTRVLVVLAERTYTREGWIQSKNDNGANVAAEHAFRLIKNLQQDSAKGQP